MNIPAKCEECPQMVTLTSAYNGEPILCHNCSWKDRFRQNLMLSLYGAGCMETYAKDITKAMIEEVDSMIKQANKNLITDLSKCPPLVKHHPNWIVFDKDEWNKIVKEHIK